MDKIVSNTPEQTIILLSNSIIALANQCISSSGQFTIALSGGSTPTLLYRHLISEHCFNKVDLSKVFIYFSDERFVSHDDVRSNYSLAKVNMFDYLDISAENINPVNTSLGNSEKSAINYQQLIKKNINTGDNDIPSFDLIILGLGADGHTASLFPGSKLLNTTELLVASCFHQQSNTDRISFTFPLINAAKNVYIISIGKAKNAILNEIKESEQNKNVKFPVQYVKPIGKLTWFTDNAAEYGE